MTLDTNVILRYLLNDLPDQAEKAAQIIESGAKSYPEIVAEVVYRTERKPIGCRKGKILCS